jgi:hypothetical protein
MLLQPWPSTSAWLVGKWVEIGDFEVAGKLASGLRLQKSPLLGYPPWKLCCCPSVIFDNSRFTYSWKRSPEAAGTPPRCCCFQGLPRPAKCCVLAVLDSCNILRFLSVNTMYSTQFTSLLLNSATIAQANSKESVSSRTFFLRNTHWYKSLTKL